METILKAAFKSMVDEYDLIVKNYYPAHDSTGLMEANQVHLFIKSLTNNNTIKDAFSWLEPPLEKVGRSYPHIDGVVFIPSKKTAIFIEAKRMSNINKKISEIYSDVDRLLVDENREHILKKVEFDVEHHYVVYLADVWLETDNKRSIPHWWCSDEIPEGILQSRSIRYKERETFIERMNSKGTEWKKDNQLIHEFKNPKKYCLMSGFHKVAATY